MGIDVKVLIDHNFSLLELRDLPRRLSAEAVPHLTALAWQHPLWRREIPADQGSWRWLLPEGCETFDDAWYYYRDTFDPNVRYVELASGAVLLTFEDRIVDLSTAVRWHIFVGNPDIQRAYQAACRELALVLGGSRCVYLADVVDSHEPGGTLDEFEASLRAAYPPVVSLEALCDGDTPPDRESVSITRYYIDRFADAPNT